MESNREQKNEFNAIEDKKFVESKKENKDPFASFEAYKKCFEKCNAIYCIVLAAIENEISKILKTEEIKQLEQRLKLNELRLLVLGHKYNLNNFIEKLKAENKENNRLFYFVLTDPNEKAKVLDKIDDNVKMLEIIATEDKNAITSFEEQIDNIQASLIQDKILLNEIKKSIDKNAITSFEEQKTTLKKIKEEIVFSTGTIRYLLAMRETNERHVENVKKLKEDKKVEKKLAKETKRNTQVSSNEEMPSVLGESKKKKFQSDQVEGIIGLKINPTKTLVLGVMYLNNYMKAKNALKRLPNKLNLFLSTLVTLNDSFKIGSIQKEVILKQFEQVPEIRQNLADAFKKELKESNFNEKFVADKIQEVYNDMDKLKPAKKSNDKARNKEKVVDNSGFYTDFELHARIADEVKSQPPAQMKRTFSDNSRRGSLFDKYASTNSVADKSQNSGDYNLSSGEYNLSSGEYNLSSGEYNSSREYDVEAIKNQLNAMDANNSPKDSQGIRKHKILREKTKENNLQVKEPREENKGLESISTNELPQDFSLQKKGKKSKSDLNMKKGNKSFYHGFLKSAKNNSEKLNSDSAELKQEKPVLLYTASKKQIKAKDKDESISEINLEVKKSSQLNK